MVTTRCYYHVRGGLLVALFTIGGCALPPKSATTCVYSATWHPTMTTADIATPNELRVHEAIEGAGGGLK